MSSSPISLALEGVERGDPAASKTLWELVYGDLKRLAASRLSRMRPGQTMHATVLVHEAWMRLGGGDAQSWQSRAHFFGAAAQAMRNIIVDEVRRKGRLRRNAGESPEQLGPELTAATGFDQVDMLALDEALTELQAGFERPARVVMLRFFSGLELGEIAELLQVARRTIDRDLLFARTWLWRRMHRGEPSTEC